MKKLGFWGRIIYFCNVVVALLLLLSIILPFIPPRTFPTLSLLSLAVSPLLLLNVLFALYWTLQWRKRAMISVFVLLIGYIVFGSFYKFSTQDESDSEVAQLSVMSFNVHLFNAYDEKASTDGADFIAEMIADHSPDVICIQEYYKEHTADFSMYPHQFIHFKEDQVLGHAIFSKYPIVNTHGFDFKDTYNNSILADIQKGTDTVRVYNLHLQSMGVLPSVGYLQDGDKSRLRRRMADAFVKQQQQAEIILEHATAAPYPTILAADLNNTSFSYVYRKFSGRFVDAFKERGNGLGTTFSFDSYPMRIDFIFASSAWDVQQFQTINSTFSDHYPVMAKLSLGSK